MQENRSEVALLRQQIRLENEATHLGLMGLASGVSRHDFIQIRMEQMERLLQANDAHDKEDALKQFEQEVTRMQEEIEKLFEDGITLCHTTIQ